MAWLFSAGSTQFLRGGPKPAIVTPALLTSVKGVFSVAARFLITSANATARYVANFNGNLQNWTLNFDTGGTNRVSFGFDVSVGTAPRVTWTSGFAAGEIHTLVGTYDFTALKVYADADATPKATAAETRVPGSDTGNIDFMIGNFFEGASNSFDGVIYQLAYWPDAVLSGQDAARFGLGYAPDMLSRRPWLYYDFKVNAWVDKYARLPLFNPAPTTHTPTQGTDINYITDARRLSRPRRFALPPPAATDGVELQAARMAWSQP